MNEWVSEVQDNSDIQGKLRVKVINCNEAYEIIIKFEDGNIVLGMLIKQ